MSNWFCRKDKENDIPEVIGEVLCVETPIFEGGGVRPPHEENVKGRYKQWRKFTEKDYDPYNNHDEYVCIFGVFFKRVDVLFYEEEAFKEFKKQVEKKYQEG